MKRFFRFFTSTPIDFAPYAIAKGEEEYRVKRAILVGIDKRCKWAAPGQEIGRGPAERSLENHA
jgi:hypothetical protein